MLFTPARLHDICTKARVRALDWRGDGFYFEGQVSLGEYRLTTYLDTVHKHRKAMTPRTILEKGESLISVQIHKARKDAIVAHPRNFMTEGNFAQRSFMVSLTAICGKSLDLNTPVVFNPEEERLVTTTSDPWLQSIFKDLQKLLGK